MIVSRRAKGFTLTELLFAMVVGTIILLAASVFLFGAAVWRKDEG